MLFVQFNSIRKRLMVISLLLSLNCCRGAVGQTADQLGARFKKVATFEVAPGINAFPTYATDGNVCRMVIERRQYLDSKNADFDVDIPNQMADQLVDKLIPPTERGKPSKYLSSKSFIAGGSSFIQQDYENVSVGMYGGSGDGKDGSVRVVVIEWTKRSCPRGQ